MKMSSHLREEVGEQKLGSVDTIDTIDTVDTIDTMDTVDNHERGEQLLCRGEGSRSENHFCSHRWMRWWCVVQCGARGQFSTYLHQYQLQLRAVCLLSELAPLAMCSALAFLALTQRYVIVLFIYCHFLVTLELCIQDTVL